MNWFHTLVRNRSGVAMIEFALGAPVVLVAGLWGTETANFALTSMRINQLAAQIADNASRVGDTSTLQNRKIYEGDINDVLYGAQLQSGKLDLFQYGRVIISSLETRPGNGVQYIHWQRCRGAKQVNSSYGLEDQDVQNGMGPQGEQVTALPDDAVIFVEVQYTYQPLISNGFVGTDEITSIASFTVRDQRDLTQIYQKDPSEPDPVQSCSAYNGPITLSTAGNIS